MVSIIRLFPDMALHCCHDSAWLSTRLYLEYRKLSGLLCSHFLKANTRRSIKWATIAVARFLASLLKDQSRTFMGILYPRDLLSVTVV